MIHFNIGTPCSEILNLIISLRFSKSMSDISPSVLNEMSDVELLCQAIHVCGEDYLTQDNSFLKSISFQKLAQVNITE